MCDKLTKVVLWLADYSDKAYTDQCGIYREGRVVLEEVEAEIFDSRIVKGDYTNEEHPHQIGYRAKSKDGRFFECCWGYWPDTTINAYAMWYQTNENRTEIISADWYNSLLTQQNYPPFVRNNARAIPPFPCCAKHDFYYDHGKECIFCKYEEGF